MKILVTGTAGFIGFHLVHRLLDRGYEVVGLDSINDYYDINLKYGRLAETGIKREAIDYGKMVQSDNSSYRFIRLRLEDRENLPDLFRREGFDFVCHLAAQAGVRYSLKNPFAYIDSNITGFLNILEASRYNNIKHLVYASSSSVYGLNEEMPFSTCQNVDHPVSLYGATKKSNELMAHSYSHLFGLPSTGLRFFTVYGPWGRPDMAYFLFMKSIIEGKAIDVYNYGDMKRDFTYIDDITAGIMKVIEKIPAPNPMWSGEFPDPSRSKSPYRIYNLGNNSPVRLIDFIETIEEAVGRKAIKRLLPLQPGDVLSTWADMDDFIRDFDYTPVVAIKEGIGKFVEWYRGFYGGAGDQGSGGVVSRES